MEIPKNINDDIWNYCRLNNITDINGFMLKMLMQGFNIEKYGSTPTKITPPEIIEKEVIKYVEKEVIKEVPVEKIVEREIIREVPVEKIITLTDEEHSKKLKEEISRLQHVAGNLQLELQNKNEELITYKNFTNTDNIVKLNNKIKNLEIELELERNRHITLEKPKEQERVRDKDVITWAEKKNNLYGE